MARRVLTAVQREGRVRELQERYEKAHEAEKKQRAAQQGAAAILVTDENIEAIRDAAKELETARARLSAAATLVAFDMPRTGCPRSRSMERHLRPIRLRWKRSRRRRSPSPITAAFPFNLRSRIETSSSHSSVRRMTHSRLRLKQCGVKSVDAAEEQLAKREKLLT